jgi:hypothetical protein
LNITGATLNKLGDGLEYINNNLNNETRLAIYKEPIQTLTVNDIIYNLTNINEDTFNTLFYMSQNVIKNNFDDDEDEEKKNLIKLDRLFN